MQLFSLLIRMISEGSFRIMKLGAAEMKIPLEELIPEYQNHLYAAAFGICRNQCDAEDVVQEVFLRYYLGKKEFDSKEHIRAWLLRVTVNLARDKVRSFWNRNKVDWEEYMDSVPFESPQDRDLFGAVMKLPEKYRASFTCTITRITRCRRSPGS